MKCKYNVYLLDGEAHILERFEYGDYDDVQNLIGYMVDGAKVVTLMISKREVGADD